MEESQARGYSRRCVAWFVLTCFFVSGLTGLTYELLWTRMITKIIGGAPFAVSIVLTVFMGGLGVGSYVASRTVDRVKDPMKLVRLYGLLELAIGAYCFILPLLLVVFKPLYVVLYNRLFEHFMLYSILTFVGCSLLLVVPVICMGATLPILCRFYVARLSHVGSHTGLLYGLNTIGAALGALLCGFWLIDWLGMQGALWLAVLTNGVIGLSCIALSYKVRLASPESQEPAAIEVRPVEQTAYPAAIVIAALVVFAVSGFCAMAYEVIWTKLLGLIVGPTTYSFTIVLVTFITCLALGSMLFGRLADWTGKPVQLLLYSQVCAALFALLVSQIFGNSQLFYAKLLWFSRDSFALMHLLKAGSLFAFMLLPTLCLGATFPLVSKICTRSVSQVGHTIGVAYAINTVGAVLGSFCAGFILIPWIGKERGLSLVVALQLLNALVVAALVVRSRKRSVFKLAPLAAPALIGLVLCFSWPHWNRYLLAKGKYHRFDQVNADIGAIGWWEALVGGSELSLGAEHYKLVYYGDGIGGFTSVIEQPRPLGGKEYVMANSGKPDASSHGDMMTQTLSAHFPMLFHPDAKSVMVLGLASGVTAGEVLYYPVELLDVIDISYQVVEGSDYFIPWNNDVLAHPKTNLIIQDGRAHLQLTRQKYDVIISEPSNPWMAGLATLFTREFFALARDRLNDDGIFVQFMHAYQMDWSNFALIGRTFTEVFPNSMLVMTNPSGVGLDYLLVGFKGQRRLDIEGAQEKLAFARKSKNVTICSPRVLYRLLATEDLSKLFDAGPLNTDNHPRLEFAAPKLMYQIDLTILERTRKAAWFGPETQQIRDEITSRIGDQLDFAAYALSLYAPFPDMVDLFSATREQEKRFYQMMEAYAAHNPVEPDVFPNPELAQRCRAVQIKTLEENLDEMPDKGLSASFLASLYYEIGYVEASVKYCREALKLKPEWAVVMNNLAWRLCIFPEADFFDAQEAVRLAEEACRRTRRREGNYLDTLATAYAAAGDFPRAVATAETALAMAIEHRDEDLARSIQNHLRLYRAGQPYARPLPSVFSR